jgi:hypothetical protein
MFRCIQSPESSTSSTPASKLNVQYRPPTPPLPRSAPYAEAHIRESNLNGYNYNYMRSPTPPVPSPEAPHTEATDLEDFEEIYHYDHSEPRKRVITDDAADYLRKTILVFHHCFRHAPLPRCFKVYSVIRVGKGRRERRLKTIDKWLSLTGNERLKRQSISRKDEG